jgi:hypothetical protein
VLVTLLSKQLFIDNETLLEKISAMLSINEMLENANSQWGVKKYLQDLGGEISWEAATW